MTPKWPRTLKVKGTPYTCYNYPRVPNFTLFRSTASHFRVTGHFETSEQNDPKMALNTKRSKVMHIHINYNSYPWVLNFTVSLASQSLSCYRTFWDKFTKWPQNELERHPICIAQLSLRPKFQSASLYGQSFLSYWPFSGKCTKWPQNGLEHQKVKRIP